MQTKISSIEISNFTVFKRNEIQFSPGLNVLIGKNGTGKTHLLKLLYSIFTSGRNAKIQPPDLAPTSNTLDNLKSVFNVQSITDLIRNPSAKTSGRTEVKLSNDEQVSLIYGFDNNDKPFTQAHTAGYKTLPECLYIPPQEMLSWYSGFAALWEKREVNFVDETYYQLAKALELPPLKSNELADVINPLRKALDAKIVKENGHFYLEYEWGRIGIHLAAEGLRKLATIIYLLANGTINEKTIILWDEPEVNFNPSLIEALVELIKGLAVRGIQIFIATHDYLLSQRLSLIAEYDPKALPVKFFCFSNEKGDGVSIEEGNTLVDIDKNPILNEFADYYDFERTLFKNSSNTHK